MKQIIHAVLIHHVAPSAVFEALTTEAGLRGWWTKQVAVEEGVGGIIRFTFGGDFNPQMKQVTLDRDRRVVWQCVDGHANWLDNTFTFSLEERNGETMLLFAQDYARELNGRGIWHLQLQLGLLPQQPEASVRNRRGSAVGSSVSRPLLANVL
jgi:uncharacterized protein YndB with AHSA1/START domain